MDMGTTASSITTANPSSRPNNSTNLKKMEKNNKLSGIRLPLLRKESSAINLSLADRSTNKRSCEAPLLRPESSGSLEAKGGSWVSLGPTALRKCETAVGLSTLALEGRPVNRSRVCSRCSSLLSLASSSRYSLAAGSFVPAATSQQQVGRLLCKLCLSDVSMSQTFTIENCGCSNCKDVCILFNHLCIADYNSSKFINFKFH
jgi:E3 ubiquitin-protein ligase RNF144